MTKRAYVNVGETVEAVVVDALAAKGITVAARAATPHAGIARLELTGDGLPAECEAACPFVMIAFATGDDGAPYVTRIVADAMPPAESV